MTWVQVQPYEVIGVWSQVRPILQRAVEAFEPDYTCEDLLLEAVYGRQQLWTCGNAVAMTQIQTFPQGKSLMLTYCAGDDVQAWFLPLWEKMREYKTAMGCRDIRGVGRAGWGKLFPDTVQKLVFLRES